jgi:hypothetical protein
MAKIPGVKNLFASIDGEFLILKTRFEKFTGETKAGNPKVCGAPFMKLDNIEGLELPPGYTLMLQLIYKAPKVIYKAPKEGYLQGPKEVEADDEEEAPVSKKPTSKKAAVTAPAKTSKKAAAVQVPAKKTTGKVTKPAVEDDEEESNDEHEVTSDEHEVTSPVMNRRTRRAA